MADCLNLGDPRSCQKDMRVRVVDGDLLDQKVDAIVNPWNMNRIPWWLLIPQGVSGAIKRRGGTQLFRELARHGPMNLGEAVSTSPGRLPFKLIIHVAGINMVWRSSERSVRDCVRNALQIACDKGIDTLAMPLIGSGSGGMSQSAAESLILDELARVQTDLREVVVVRWPG